METKRFIGNDMPRLYEKVRAAFGSDAVIVRTRTLMRDGAEPLIEIEAGPPDGDSGPGLDLQRTLISGALAQLDRLRPGTTIGDIEDIVAREPGRAGFPSVSDEGVAWGETPRLPRAELHQPPPRQGYAADTDELSSFPAWELEPDIPAGDDRPSRVVRGIRPVTPTGGQPTDIHAELIAGGIADEAAAIITRLAPDEVTRRGALESALRRLPVRYPAERVRALITMQGPPGAGRTTALLRMALDCADSGRPAALIAADTSRAAAREQISYYGEATGLAVFDCADAAALRRAVMSSRPGTCLFADVPAGPFVAPSLPGAAVHAYLALPAHWQAEVLRRAVAPFGTSAFDGVVLTHTDLAPQLSPALSLAVEAEVGIAFLSCGRDISAGLEPADPFTLASGILRTPAGVSADGFLVATA